MGTEMEGKRVRLLASLVVVGCAALAAAQLSGCRASMPASAGGGGGGHVPDPHDWTRFGWDAGRSSAPGFAMGVTA